MYVREVSLCLIKIPVHFCSMIFAIPNLNWFDFRCGRYRTMTKYKKLRKKMKPWKLIWTTRSFVVFCYSFLVYFQAINIGLDLYLAFFFFSHIILYVNSSPICRKNLLHHHMLENRSREKIRLPGICVTLFVQAQKNCRRKISN